MINKILLTFCCFGLLLCSCAKTTNNPKAELLNIIEKLKNDEGHKFLMTLKPLENDFYKIFKDSAAVEKAKNYSKNKWDFIDELPEDVMKPVNKDDEIVVAMANKNQLEHLIYNGLSSDYGSMAEYLKEGVMVYGIHYFNMNGLQLKNRAAFFKVDNRWIFIPNIFEAFI